MCSPFSRDKTWNIIFIIKVNICIEIFFNFIIMMLKYLFNNVIQ